MALRGVIWAAVSTKAQTTNDKFSLPDQEQMGRDFFEAEGIQLLTVLRVPGHSRYYTDIHKAASAMRKKGIDAMDRLLEFWEAKAFDVLWVRDGDRFGRTQSLHSRVVEETIFMGARIFSYNDGWVDRRNFRFFIAMSGAKSAGHVDDMVQKRDKGLTERMRRGLPPAEPPMSHIVEHEIATGKALRTIVNEAMRPLFRDMARLLVVQNIGWGTIELNLAKLGHLHPATGKPYPIGYLYQVVFNPIFWGHAARKYRGISAGEWMWNPDVPPPSPVMMAYNTHEPMWQGVVATDIDADSMPIAITADQIKAVLLHRQIVSKGHAAPKSYPFTGLLICGYCSSRLGKSQWGKKWPDSFGWVCPYRNRLQLDCLSQRQIPNREVKRYVDKLLRVLLLADDPHLIVNDVREAGDASGETPMLETMLSALRAERVDLERKIKIWQMKQAEADDGFVSGSYDDLIQNAAARRAAIERESRELESSIEPPQRREQRVAALETIKVSGVDKFWELSSLEINRTLHSIFGDVRMVVVDGVIVRRAHQPKQVAGRLVR